MLDAPLAIVDLETTGAHPVWDRITEIAVLEVEGAEVVSEWSTLVNPGTAIPAAIQALTGITNEMVADAPAFEDLASALHERLAGRVLVAHNARFDYGFLRHAFERAGLQFRARTLCTVRLSRRLYPECARHNLDSVIERHKLRCNARHRALGDAQVVWQFLRAAAEQRGADALADAAKELARLPSLPPYIGRELVDAIPEAPGVYLFYGERGTPLYVGKSVAMRSRVLAHFADGVRSAREMQLAREVRTIEWQRSCGELGALLREAALVKELLPVFNRRLRLPSELCAFVVDAKGLQLVRVGEVEAQALPGLSGLFRSRRAALDALHGLADEHRFCLQTLGFERAGARKGACFRHQIRRCGGVCAGRETLHAHHARLAAALAGLKIMASLELLLARGRTARAEAAALERWLARAFGLGEAPLPAGALTVLALGGNPGTDFWLRADPVHLRVLRDRLALIPSAGFSIERDEAQALAEALNRHFAGELALDAAQPECWCLRARGAVALEAQPPIEIAGEDVDANLPRGADAARWNALLNEVQMLLHDHPVNEAREQRGAPPVNSIWLWGGGAIPRAAAAPWHSVSADDPAALGLARLAGARQRTLPTGAGEWLGRAPEDGRHLLLLDALRGAPALGDAESLERRLRMLEERWFAPLLAALKAGRVGMVTVQVPDAGLSIETVRGDLRRFWRRPRALASYAA